MEIPVIDLKGLAGGDEERERTMAQLHEACKDWGFFWVENHGVEAALMEEVKSFVYRHYDEHLEKKFYASDLAKNLHLNKDDGDVLVDGGDLADQADWEATYFIQHRPKNTAADFPDIPPAARESLDTYIAQAVSLAELRAGCISTNLGLSDTDRVRDAFAPPFVGTRDGARRRGTR